MASMRCSCTSGTRMRPTTLAKNPLYLASESQGSQYAFPLASAIIRHNAAVNTNLTNTTNS